MRPNDGQSELCQQLILRQIYAVVRRARVLLLSKLSEGSCSYPKIIQGTDFVMPQLIHHACCDLSISKLDGSESISQFFGAGGGEFCKRRPHSVRLHPKNS